MTLVKLGLLVSVVVPEVSSVARVVVGPSTFKKAPLETDVGPKILAPLCKLVVPASTAKELITRAPLVNVVFPALIRTSFRIVPAPDPVKVPVEPTATASLTKVLIRLAVPSTPSVLRRKALSAFSRPVDSTRAVPVTNALLVSTVVPNVSSVFRLVVAPSAVSVAPLDTVELPKTLAPFCKDVVPASTFKALVTEAPVLKLLKPLLVRELSVVPAPVALSVPVTPTVVLLLTGVLSRVAVPLTTSVLDRKELAALSVPLDSTIAAPVMLAPAVNVVEPKVSRVFSVVPAPLAVKAAPDETVLAPNTVALVCRSVVPASTERFPETEAFVFKFVLPLLVKELKTVEAPVPVNVPVEPTAVALVTGVFVKVAVPLTVSGPAMVELVALS